MKSVLISIQPKWCEKIANGEKTIEVRKSRPKLETPFKCYIYCTIGNGVKGDYLVPSGIQCGKVIGEFFCDRIDEYVLTLDNGDNYSTKDFMYSPLKDACLTQEEIVNYGNGKMLYGWHIADLKIYDKPKELSEFYIFDSDKRRPSVDCEYKKRGFSHDWCLQTDNRFCNELLCDKKRIKRPPQSWCYVEEYKNG